MQEMNEQEKGKQMRDNLEMEERCPFTRLTAKKKPVTFLSREPS
jgi:hypothetical protein